MKSKRPKLFLIFTILIIFILAAVGFLVASNFKMYKRRMEVSLLTDSYKQEINKLEQENNKMKSGLPQGSEEYIEKEIRERLDLKKPGENVVIVIPPKENGEVKQEEPKNFWEKLWKDIKSLWD